MRDQLKKADILGLAIVAGSLIAYSVRSVWSIYQTIAVVIGAILIVASLAVKSDEIRVGLGRRSTRFGANSAASIFFLIGILAFVNYLGAQHVKRIDTTTEKIYSLSDESSKVAQQINQDLHIRAFYSGGEYAPAKEVLDLFKAKNNKISYEFIDPDKQPQMAAQYQVTQYGEFQNPMSGESFRYGTLILQMGGKTERIEKQSEALHEEDITNAMLKLVKGEKKTIYFTQGHGEKSIDDNDKSGYSNAKAGLEKENYVVKTVNLAEQGKVPDDASVVVMDGPKNEPFPNEMDSLDAFLNKGGSVYIMVDPSPSPGLTDFMKKWSIDVGNNIVLDASGLGRLFGAGPEIPLVTKYSDQKITSGMKGVMTFFPLARSVTPAMNPPAGLMVESLFSSSERSWGETNMKSGEAKFDEGTDLKGPVSLAVVATKDLGNNKKARLVVFGDSDFAVNSMFAQQGNGNLFLNTVAWLAQDENFISIRAKNPEDRRLTMTDAQGRLVSFVMLLLLPVGIVITGISVWVKRRR
ncbi:MAG TPA: Gldg family protein [Terriglobia bacterium]|nr:Gldg family protein [Terriglobia bacterium]